MLAQQLSHIFSARGIHYAWFVAVLTFCFSLATSTALTVPGVLIIPMSKEFGWSLGDISSAMALRLFLFGAIAPFAGALMVRYGLTRIMSISASLVVVGVLMAAVMTEKWQLWLSVGVILGVAPGMTALVVSATVASRWFTQRRGLVVGMLAAAVATGQLIFLPVVAWISEHYGWRMALMPTAVAVTVCGVLYALFACNHPSDLGLPPYGEGEVLPAPTAASSGAVSLSFRALREASRVPAFWVLFGTFFVCGASSIGLMGPHFVPLCADFGVTAITAAGLLAVMGIFDFIGTIGSGWLSDRYDSRWLLSMYYGLRGISLLWLPFSTFSFWGLSVFAIFFGLDYIATVPPTVKIAVQALGRERAPIVFGWIFAGHQLGAAVMAVAGGVSRDMLATYLPAFFIAGAICVVAAASMLILIGPRSPTAKATASTPA